MKNGGSKRAREVRNDESDFKKKYKTKVEVYDERGYSETPRSSRTCWKPTYKYKIRYWKIEGHDVNHIETHWTSKKG